MKQRDKEGKFLRTRKQWSLSNFDDGYLDSKGRVRVYAPHHPRSSKEGYVLRSIIAWESYHGRRVLYGLQVHHKNGNRADDSEENLEVVNQKEHGLLHRITVKRTCKHCGEEFSIQKWKLKDISRGTFCSQNCYHKHPRNKSHKKAIALGLVAAYAEGRR